MALNIDLMSIQLTKCYNHDTLSYNTHYPFPSDAHCHSHGDRCVRMAILSYRADWRQCKGQNSKEKQK